MNRLNLGPQICECYRVFPHFNHKKGATDLGELRTGKRGSEKSKSRVGKRGEKMEIMGGKEKKGHRTTDTST